MLRVSSGSLKKRKLQMPKSIGESRTRPTTSRIKNAIFNIIKKYITENTRVLDLYAGSGQMGIEALSLGAKDCTFVEKWTNAVKIIKKNLNNLNFETEAIVYQKSVEDFLENYTENKYFDIIFVDPPYTETAIAKYLEIIDLLEKLTNDGGIIIVRHRPQIELNPENKAPRTKVLGIRELYTSKMSAGADSRLWSLHPRVETLGCKDRSKALVYADKRIYGSNCVSFFVKPFAETLKKQIHS